MRSYFQTLLLRAYPIVKRWQILADIRPQESWKRQGKRPARRVR